MWYIIPNFIFFSQGAENPVITDIGCGYTPKFGAGMIEKYAAECVVVDPTRKHKPTLTYPCGTIWGLVRAFSFCRMRQQRDPDLLSVECQRKWFHLCRSRQCGADEDTFVRSTGNHPVFLAPLPWAGRRRHPQTGHQRG